MYRHAILQYGLWDQLGVDHGKEFLYIYEQLCLAGHGNINIAPHQWRSYTRAYTGLGPGELCECQGIFGGLLNCANCEGTAYQ